MEVLFSTTKPEGNEPIRSQKSNGLKIPQVTKRAEQAISHDRYEVYYTAVRGSLEKIEGESSGGKKLLTGARRGQAPDLNMLCRNPRSARMMVCKLRGQRVARSQLYAA